MRATYMSVPYTIFSYTSHLTADYVSIKVIYGYRKSNILRFILYTSVLYPFTSSTIIFPSLSYTKSALYVIFCSFFQSYTNHSCNKKLICDLRFVILQAFSNIFNSTLLLYSFVDCFHPFGTFPYLLLRFG